MQTSIWAGNFFLTGNFRAVSMYVLGKKGVVSVVAIVLTDENNKKKTLKIVFSLREWKKNWEEWILSEDPVIFKIHHLMSKINA